MNALKLYWANKRQESIATLTVLLTSSLLFLIPALWYQHPMVVFVAWGLCSSGILGHALCMVLVHWQQRQKPYAASGSLANLKLMVSIILALSVLRSGASELPYTQHPQPPPGTTAPFEFDVTLYTGSVNNQDNPQAAIIPAAVCVGIGVGIIGWVGIKLWSACLEIQIRQATNRVNMVPEFNAAAALLTGQLEVPSTSNPVSGSGCACSQPPTASPMPLLLEHHDGHSWTTVSAGMIHGQQLFVPDTGTWRITPMKIIATRDAMIVPPGTLEYSTDLKTWTLLSVSATTRNITPEPNHFYRIR